MSCKPDGSPFAGTLMHGESAVGTVADGTIFVSVQRGSLLWVVSDLHLHAVSCDDSESITSELARHLETFVGPGVLVLAGDTFELTDEPNNSPQRALTAHPRLAEALRRFARGDDHVLVVLAGDHDIRLMTSSRDRRELQAIGALVGRRSDVSVETGAGIELVRIEHSSDHPAALSDATTSPVRIAAADRDASIRFYKAVQRSWWIPILAAIAVVLAAVIVAVHVTNGRDPIHHISSLRWLYFACSTITIQIVLSSVTFTFIKHHFASPVRPIDNTNRSALARAAELAGSGFAGFVGTGSHSPQLVDLGPCWYANSGCALRHTTRRDAHFGLPAVYAQSNELSWLEMEAGATLHVSLVASRRDDRPASRLERWASKARPDVPAMPAQVATLQLGTVWPPPTNPFAAATRSRRLSAVGLFAIGLVDLLSALTPPLRGRLHDVRQIIPVSSAPVAAGLVAASGIGLMMLATGLRRGRRLAWQMAMALLAFSTIGHLVKGFDVEEATLAGLFAVWLGSRSEAFTAPTEAGQLRRAVTLGAASLVGIGLAASAWMSIEARLAIGRSTSIAFGRMIGTSNAAVPSHEEPLISALPAASVATVLVIGWYVLRARHAPIDDPTTTRRAWQIVREHGRDTLDYFALRDDKRHFISEGTVVAYTVTRGTAVVSPDPVGPADQRSYAWNSFRGFAAANGWRVAVLGAATAWLPVYRSSGMWTMYIGDESIVDVQRFALDGGRNKSLRQAVNRIANAGYTVEFHDPAHVEPALASELRQLAHTSRQGSVERGFSMTLSRLFDPRDQGLLMAVTRDTSGRPAAFCQFVPATGIDGYSLDLMRRSDTGDKCGTANARPAMTGGNTRAARGGHPNGLTEFTVVRTIEHLRDEGRHGLGLHFATMRGLLAGQTGSRMWHRIMADVLHRLSDDMQIESLWKFNAKFNPTWLPRYVVVDAPESTLYAGLAIARVESLWELPVIGRFLRPSTDLLDAPGVVSRPIDHGRATPAQSTFGAHEKTPND